MARYRGQKALASMTLKFDLGRAFQFVWNEEGLLVGSICRRTQVFQMKLCASRAFWLVAYTCKGHRMLFDAQNIVIYGLGTQPIFDQ